MHSRVSAKKKIRAQQELAESGRAQQGKCEKKKGLLCPDFSARLPCCALFLFFFALALLCAYFSTHLPCCARERRDG